MYYFKRGGGHKSKYEYYLFWVGYIHRYVLYLWVYHEVVLRLKIRSSSYQLKLRIGIGLKDVHQLYWQLNLQKKFSLNHSKEAKN